MRIVIAPDKFKGSLSGAEVIECLRAGLNKAAQETEANFDITAVPVADGGEGTLDAAIDANFTAETLKVTGPTGEPVDAKYGIRGKDAVIEMATASGLKLLAAGVLNPLGATSRGTGELISAALDRGCRRITLAVGGSASTDGGAGMISALGVRLLDADENEIAPGGGGLAYLERIDASELDERIKQTEFILASDVENVLLGLSGAAAVFGPQKGASPEDISLLENGLKRLVACLGQALGETAAAAANLPGSGAAGGVGYGALAVLQATRRSGTDVVFELTHLHEALDGADLVITGEGSLDEQSLAGKTPIGVARAAAARNIPVVAVCGQNSVDQAVLQRAHIQYVYELSQIAQSTQDSMHKAAELLEQIGHSIGLQWAK